MHHWHRLRLQALPCLCLCQVAPCLWPAPCPAGMAPTPYPSAPLCSEVLAELRRLMPAVDPVATLLNDPSWLLRVERGRRRLGDDPDT